ncbi:hypothetical protein ZIOFF_070368 [Zingiber officinale]|uniref:Uncharacterized protein n=1 Tax=Zingiber officinale TaxID=94328 RepID=A0A8J5C5H6_ZINOF|nr:hypothetical protein ZIOFF_070368 [Zingiber officinale]
MEGVDADLNAWSFLAVARQLVVTFLDLLWVDMELESLFILLCFYTSSFSYNFAGVWWIHNWETICVLKCSE